MASREASTPPTATFDVTRRDWNHSICVSCGGFSPSVAALTIKVESLGLGLLVVDIEHVVEQSTQLIASWHLVQPATHGLQVHGVCEAARRSAEKVPVWCIVVPSAAGLVPPRSP